MATLHLRCGTDIRDALALAGAAGEFLEWGDPVCQGPVRPLPEPEYLEERRAWLSTAWDIPREELDRKLWPLSQLPARLDPHDEVCLWFEHDLFDQTMLVQVLAGLADSPALHDRLRLISIDRHPDLERFVGFGQLRPEQLAPLHAGRGPVPSAAFELATRAWDALREPSPDRLRTTSWASDALPFLAGALGRHLQEFPAEDSGLGLTQRLTLQAIEDSRARQGVAFAVQVFGALMSSLDPQPWLGDLMFWAYLRELAGGSRPLITMLGEFPAEELALTELGRRVLVGDENWLRVSGPPPHGPSRWRGGVEIVGAQSR